MRTHTKWALGVGFASLLFGGLALAASNLVTTTLTGVNEYILVQSGGVGGQGNVVPDYVLRSGSNHQLVPTGTTVNTTVLPYNQNVLATGAITTWNVTFPNNPFAGQEISVNCPGGTITTLTIAAGATPTGQTLVGTNPTSCTSGGAITNGSSWQYSLSANTWYRYQ